MVGENMSTKNVIARNKKAHHEYFILEDLECGIVLTGTEIKSIRQGKVSIQDAYCAIERNELVIENMHIAKYKEGNIFNHNEIRRRKLLAHRSEIKKLIGKISQEGLTLIPLEIYIKDGLAKLEIAVCRGKKSYDKREDLKQKDIKKQIAKMNQY